MIVFCVIGFSFPFSFFVGFWFLRMETEGINLNREASGGERGNNGKIGDGFVDRSKVRILLCDNDSKSSEEVFTLLLRCSYQGI